MNLKVDETDRSIVRLLQEDGRMPCAEIARRIGNVSERVVRFRIKNLIQEGTIEVSAVVNPKAVGYPVTADVSIEVEPAQIMEIAQKLASLEEVNYLSCSSGHFGISLQVVARDNMDLHRLITEVIGKVQGVKKVSMLVVPLILKDVHRWSIPQEAAANGKEDRKSKPTAYL